MNGKTRLQFDFTSEAVDRLDELKNRINAPTKAEVVRRSLRLFDWITREMEQGAIIGIEKDGKLIYLKEI